LIELLLEKGAEVIYNDPHIPSIPAVRKYSFSMDNTELTPEILAAADCVLLATDHSAYDYQFILDHADLIIDTRNAFTGLKGAAEKVVQA
jgi:UDP-N-acetyl-D-glucosamine dehydrogenase